MSRGRRTDRAFDERPADPLGTVPRHARGSRKRHGGVNRALIVLAFVACIAVVAGVAITGIKLIQGRADTETTSTTTASEATISVKQGMGATQVGQLLVEAGLIDTASEFVDLVKARGSENAIKPGTYRFSKGEELLALVEALEKGGTADLKITIPEGKAADQVAQLLDTAGNIDGDSYLQLAEQPDKFKVPKVGDSAPEVDTLEGLLFPSTYFMIEGDGATELIGAQLAAFESKTASLPWSKAADSGADPVRGRDRRFNDREGGERRGRAGKSGSRHIQQA